MHFEIFGNRGQHKLHRSEKMITNLEYFGWWSKEDVLLINTWKLFCGPQFLGILVVEFGVGKFFRAPMIPRLRISFFCWAAPVPVGPNCRCPAG